MKTKLMLIPQKIFFDNLTSQKTYLAGKMNIVILTELNNPTKTSFLIHICM